VFSIFHFVPGAYVDDEHIVEQVGAVPTKKDFFFDLKKSLVDFYTLDFGVTYHNHNSKVMDLIWQKATFSFRYLGFTLILLFSASILFSYLIVRSKYRWMFLSFFKVLSQIPQLVLIPLIIYFFSYFFSIVPLKFDPYNSWCLLFVVFTLALKPLSQLIHLTAEKWHKEMGEVYVQFARAKGLSRNRVMFVHVFKNIANSFLAYFLTITLQLLTGNFILESLYSIPGFGLGFMDSVSQRDLPLVIGYIFLFSGLYLTLHFATQVLFVYLNPRLRENG
jgi:oligopeptide transport system permease protein